MRISASWANVIVAHDNVRARMSSDQYHLVFKAGTPPHPEAALPVITFSETMTFHFNDDVIHVDAYSQCAHTDGDAIFYFEKSRRHAHRRCVHQPGLSVDRHRERRNDQRARSKAPTGCWRLVGPDTIIIPGHGPLADRVRMIEIRDMLVTARTAVVKLLERGMSLDEIQAAKPLEELDARWAEGIVKGRLFTRIIYQSETGDWAVPDQ